MEYPSDVKNLAQTPISQIGTQKSAGDDYNSPKNVLVDSFLQYGVPSAAIGAGGAIVMKVLSDLKQNRNDAREAKNKKTDPNSFEVVVPAPKTAMFPAWQLAGELENPNVKLAAEPPSHWATSLSTDAAMATLPAVAAYMALDKVFKNRENKELKRQISAIKDDYSNLLVRDIERQRAALGEPNAKAASITPVEALIEGLVDMKHAGLHESAEGDEQRLQQIVDSTVDRYESIKTAASDLKMFYFEGRKRGISARSEEEARKKINDAGSSLKLKKVASFDKEAATKGLHGITGAPLLLALIAGVASHRYAMGKERNVDEYYNNIGKKKTKQPTRVKLVSAKPAIGPASDEPTAGEEEREEEEAGKKAAELDLENTTLPDLAEKQKQKIQQANKATQLGQGGQQQAQTSSPNQETNHESNKNASLAGPGLLGVKLFEMADEKPTGIKAELAERESADLSEQEEKQRELARSLPVDHIDGNTVVLNTPNGQIVIDASDPGSLEYLKGNQEALFDSLNSVNSGH